MRKIPTIFERDWNGDRSRVVDKPHPDCAWVFAGDGVATRKLDGACCMVREGKLFKRREIRLGQQTPLGMEVVQVDDETGKAVGWVPVGDGPEDKWFRAAFEHALSDAEMGLLDGTYEAIGPHHQGGIEPDFGVDTLVSHQWAELLRNVPSERTFESLRDWLAGQNIEGLVFHHSDGRMGKIKLRDFGLKRAVR